MVVFLDVLILENFIVNYFLIHLTAQTIRVKTKAPWHTLSAFMGSMYVITLIYPSLRVFTALPFKLLAALMIIIIAFNTKKRKKVSFILKATLIYILYSIVLAGMCFFIEMNSKFTTDLSSVLYNFSYKKLLLTLMVSYIFIYRMVVYIKDRKEVSMLIYEVNIKTANSFKRIKAFLDTGNELREPATNLPVMVMNKSYMEDLDTKNCDKYYIPYRVVNGQVGNMEAFRPEYIEISLHGEPCRRDVIIALTEGEICELDEYQALLSRGII